jgi:hypothetical protein
MVIKHLLSYPSHPPLSLLHFIEHMLQHFVIRICLFIVIRICFGKFHHMLRLMLMSYNHRPNFVTLRTRLLNNLF